VGGADLFFDEAVDYACRLVHAGVPTELHVSADGVHGFENLAPGTALAKRATWNVEDWLRGALAPTERIPFYRGGP
jgi:acetyl esterase/lipase